MSDTRSFIPLHIQKKLAELAGKPFQKALGPTAPAASSPDTVAEWVNDATFVAEERKSGTVESDFRVPTGRAAGNQVFRRYHNGTLDLDAARDVVIDVIYKFKWNTQPLTDLEKLILTVHFPAVFDFYDPRVAVKMAAHHLNLTDTERQLVSAKVAAQLNQNMAGVVSGTGVSS